MIRKAAIALSLMLSGCSQLPVNFNADYMVEPGVILDTGADRTSISFMPEGAEVIKHVTVYSAAGSQQRPIVKWVADYYGCRMELEVSVREKSLYLADVLLGRDFIRGCGFRVVVQ